MSNTVKSSESYLDLLLKEYTFFTLLYSITKTHKVPFDGSSQGHTSDLVLQSLVVIPGYPKVYKYKKTNKEKQGKMKNLQSHSNRKKTVFCGNDVGNLVYTPSV